MAVVSFCLIFLQGEQKLLFFQFPDVLPIKPVSADQEEPMPVEEASSDQPATEGKVWIVTRVLSNVIFTSNCTNRELN